MDELAFRLDVVFYLRKTLGIQYVNMDQLEVDMTRPNGYIFGTHRFTARKLSNGMYVFNACI